jgi:hypothetical protein
LITEVCTPSIIGQRRVFWSTQPRACGEYTQCGEQCSIPGLAYEDREDSYPDQSLPDDVGSIFRTIKTDNWLHGLILNILNTRARSDIPCSTPAATYGHWSESYRNDNLYIGSTMWNEAEKPYARISDAVNAIGRAVQTDMGKLVVLGVAQSVEAEVTYKGLNRVAVNIKTVTVSGRSTINLSGTYVSETWVWH